LNGQATRENAKEAKEEGGWGMNSGTPAGKIVLGFLAGAAAVLVAHQIVVLVLYQFGLAMNPPYSFRPNGSGVPTIVSQVFWGGVWGVLFGLVVGFLPSTWPTWLKGIVFGLGIHVVLGNWFVLALARGQPMFANFVPLRLLVGGLIGTCFGIGVAYIYPLLARRLARSPA
jgi:hypothetical protein